MMVDIILEAFKDEAAAKTRAAHLLTSGYPNASVLESKSCSLDFTDVDSTVNQWTNAAGQITFVVVAWK